ncbi:MAG: AAA family ATPase [Candidatus Oleimicrobiaceae bacterium]
MDPSGRTPLLDPSSAVVIFLGPPGVGKTRLTQELISYARKQFKIFQGHCPELIRLVYHPWSEAVRKRLELKREDLQAIPSLWLAEVAKIAPQLRVQMPELAENPPLPPQQEPLRFFEGLAQFFLGLVNVGANGLVVFLDDLHWADAASLDFLNYFLSRIPKKSILILGTYRGEEMSE